MPILQIQNVHLNIYRQFKAWGKSTRPVALFNSSLEAIQKRYKCVSPLENRYTLSYNGIESKPGIDVFPGSPAFDVFRSEAGLTNTNRHNFLTCPGFNLGITS
jgi:hypothetical protein